MTDEQLADLTERLCTVSNMINLGERISWGQDSAIMDEAAAALSGLLAEVAGLREENAELHRKLGGGCDATKGDHVVIRQGRYSFCAECGESLKGIRYCHEPRAALSVPAVVGRV